MAAIITHEKGSFTFTVGKLDAGMAILIGSRAHLIEFPSILLPEGVTVGSIVSIDVHRNHAEEDQTKSRFWKLQNDIYTSYGIKKPVTPRLQLRHVTQTSVTLEWPPIQLATAGLRSLDIYRNGQRLANIPNPTSNTSTKLSGLQTNTPYTFQLVLRTTAGTFPSNIVQVQTHTLEDTSGISVCFGTILDSDVGGAGAAERKEELKRALDSMGAKYSEKIQIDTTHFVCTTSLSLAAVSREGGASRAGPIADEPGVEYQKALQLSIPIVQPDWVLACYYQKKMVPTAPYYLGTTVPPLTQGHARVQSVSQQQHPLPPNSPPTSGTPQSKRTSQPPSRTNISSTSRTAVNEVRRDSASTPPPKSRKGDSMSHIAKKFGEVAAAQEGTPSSGSPTVLPIHPVDNSQSTPVATLPTTSAATNALTNIVTPELLEGQEGGDEDESPTTPSSRRRTGTMNKTFKFPPDDKSKGQLRITPPPAVPPVPPIIVVHEAKDSVASMKGNEAPKQTETSSKGNGGQVKRVMPEPPTPDLANEDVVKGRARADSDADGGEFGEVDLS